LNNKCCSTTYAVVVVNGTDDRKAVFLVELLSLLVTRVYVDPNLLDVGLRLLTVSNQLLKQAGRNLAAAVGREHADGRDVDARVNRRGLVLLLGTAASGDELVVRA
jgi:hypothetical protein